MVIRFEFAALTKRNEESNEVSHLTACVWREEEPGIKQCAVSDSPALIRGAMLFIVGLTLLYALVKWSKHINVMESDHENTPKPDPPPISCSLPSTFIFPL